MAQHRVRSGQGHDKAGMCAGTPPPPPPQKALAVCAHSVCICVRVHVRVEGGSQSVKACTVMQGLETLPLVPAAPCRCVGLKSAARSPPQLKADRSSGLSTPFLAFILMF